MNISWKISGYNALAFVFMAVAAFLVYISFDSVDWVNDEHSTPEYEYKQTLGMWESCKCYDVTKDYFKRTGKTLNERKIVAVFRVFV